MLALTAACRHHVGAARASLRSSLLSVFHVPIARSANFLALSVLTPGPAPFSLREIRELMDTRKSVLVPKGNLKKISPAKSVGLAHGASFTLQKRSRSPPLQVVECFLRLDI